MAVTFVARLVGALRLRRCVYVEFRSRPLCLTLLSIALAFISAAPNVGASIQEPSNDLVVQFDAAIWGTPEELALAVSARVPLVLSALGGPVAGQPLVQLRILPEYLREMRVDDARIGLHESVVLTYSGKVATDSAETLLRSRLGVKAVVRGNLTPYSTPPNDPLLSATSSIAEYQWAAERLKLFAAWDKIRGTAYAAVLDNGIQIRGLIPSSPVTHPDLVGNYRQQFSRNFDLNNGPNGSANTAGNLDEEPYTVTISGITYPNVAGHGSHTAGIVTARGNNGIGTTGTCQLCALLLGRISVWDSTAQRLATSPAPYVAGMSWMTNAGAQVIANSFLIDPVGCTYPGTAGTPCAVLDAANAQDVVVVAASGNARASTIDFPARYSQVFAVGGVQYDANGVQFWDGSGVFGSNYSTTLTTFSAPARRRVYGLHRD